MTISTDPALLNKITAQAAEMAAGLRGVAEGKEPTTVTHSDARTFANLASMLSTLALVVSEAKADVDRRTVALDRVANLRIRDATGLLEKQDWKKIATELQSIAQEALGTDA